MNPQSEDEVPWRACLVVATSSDEPYLAPFCGGARLGLSFAVIPRGQEPRLGYFSPMERQEAAKSGLPLLTPEQLDMLRWTRDGALPDELWANVLSRALHLCEIAPGPLAIAGSLSAGWLDGCCRRLEAEGWSFLAGELWLDQRRKKKKSSLELAELRSVAAGTCAAFRRVAEILRQAEAVAGQLRWSEQPLRVGTLRREVGLALCRHDLEQPARNIIAPGEEGAVPHNIGTDDRILRAGESIVVDLFPKRRVFADCTRTFCVGPPTDELAAAHGHVEVALDHAERSAIAGAWGWSVQEQVCEIFAAAGYQTPISHPGARIGYVHGLGHGVGFELHELPSFRSGVPEIHGRLAVDDVITLEPGLYDEEAGWAIRTENLYIVTREGLENLTPLPRSLDPEDW